MSGPVFPDSPLRMVVPKGQAPRIERAFGYRTAEDLMRHFPRRYVQLNDRYSLDELQVGEVVSFLATVLQQKERRLRQRGGFIVDVTVADQLGNTLQLSFFHGYLARRQLTEGTAALFYGKVTEFQGSKNMTNPEFEVIMTGDGQPVSSWGIEAEHPERMPLPLYPGSGEVSAFTMRRYIKEAFEAIDFSAWTDPIPEHIRREEGIPGLHDAYQSVHRPVLAADAEAGLRRFQFEEALILQGSLGRRRREAAQLPGIPAPRRSGGVLEAFDAQLPFELTEGQRRCGEWIAQDLERSRPMNRLLQGEVGSGKTLVALRAMLQVADSGAQAALIAPTEVLAAQHAQSLRRMLGELAQDDLFTAGDQSPKVKLTLLTGSMKTAERRQAMLDIVTGEAGIIVGTHALLSEKVSFLKLGLVVVDEQHRFGVQQRNALRERYTPTPHMLVMSATPIPRSVAMTVFGDLELTVLAGLPGGRSPIETYVVPTQRGPEWINRVWQRAAEQISQGHQVFVVCPEITNEQGSLDASVELISQRLQQVEQLAGARTAVAHGRLPAEEVAETMRAFEQGRLDVLVATTIIEVGVDVPNATTMVILDADSFGVSTLHQLRGRIGRGTTTTNRCFLVTRLPEDHPSVQRLHDVAQHTDGMHLARLDLQRRREGDVLGASQAGVSKHLKLLSVIRHEEIISLAAAHIDTLFDRDPEWKTARELHQAVMAWEAEHSEAVDFADQG